MDTQDLLTAFIRMSPEQQQNFITELEEERGFGKPIDASIINGFRTLAVLSRQEFKDAAFNEIYREVKGMAA